MDMSPCMARARVRGIGVADMANTCGALGRIVMARFSLFPPSMTVSMLSSLPMMSLSWTCTNFQGVDNSLSISQLALWLMKKMQAHRKVLRPCC
jgi:hypothetical protein